MAPQVQATPVGEISDFAALLVLDYEAESGVMKQNTVYFPHLVSMSRLSLDPARQPLSYTMEAMAIADTVGMPDGDQIVTTHMFFSGFTQ